MEEEAKTLKLSEHFMVSKNAENPKAHVVFLLPVHSGHWLSGWVVEGGGTVQLSACPTTVHVICEY